MNNSVITRMPWSSKEIRTFFSCYELYQNDFNSYTCHLNRTYSQIKGFFHNWLKQQPEEIRQQYQIGKRGGKHLAFRNYQEQNHKIADQLFLLLQQQALI
ncbi:Homeobox-like_domain superfamily [Hexamita inflata]|uniref:Homeobox-like domain superfamily n=1 Tax=Hexamita inflata TaxID=28002 RepID=A0AA86TJK0_9EUKA|nr:Homeobox-like domain superfamily [Hexamita inflata]